MRREAGACGGSEQAEGAPQKSVKESRGSHEKEAGEYKGEVLMYPKPLSCMSSGDPGRAGFTPSLRMKRGLRVAGELPAHRGKESSPQPFPVVPLHRCGPSGTSS